MALIRDAQRRNNRLAEGESGLIDGLGMKAKHCDTCQHKTVEEAILTGGQWKTCVLTCAIGHKPRFFKPRYIHDYEWGWKRKCEDYKNAD